MTATSTNSGMPSMDYKEWLVVKEVECNLVRVNNSVLTKAGRSTSKWAEGKIP